MAHIAPYDVEGRNGVTRAVLNWARILPKCGIDIEIWDFSPAVTSVVKAESELCRVFRLPCFESRIRGMISLPEETRRFLSVRVKCVDVLHLHSVFRPENHWVSRLGVPFVVSPHNGYHAELLCGRSRWKKMAAGYLWERANLNRADTVIALNGREYKDLHRYGIKTKTLQLPNILDPDILERAATASPPGSLWVFLGRLDVEVKGLDTLLKGFAMFRRFQGKSGHRLVIAGPDFRNGLARLKQLAGEYGVSDWVDFPGPKFGGQKVELLERTAVFLHPSRAEGLPYSILEALAFGRPVVVTQATNLADLVASYGAGWVVELTADRIAEALHRIAAITPEELHTIGESGRALIRSEFEADPIARRLASVYQELAG